jgi:neutral ceramidase
VARRLQAKAGVKPERFVACSTHTHDGPWLIGFAPALLSEPLPAEHRVHMEQYQRQLTDKMEQVARSALAERRPARLAWAEGAVHFAMNRRPLQDGRSTGIGVNPDGPVDHSLPLLCASDAQGKVFAVVVNYACHCTTIGGSFNQIHGDWAGMAQQYIEAEHPGATALVCLGCGADANPNPHGKVEMTALHGRAVADEVTRLLKEKLTPLGPELSTRLWITAYANDVPCYIVSRRLLGEGGYEPDSSMIYYEKPSRLAPVVEDRIIGAAESLVPKSFAAGSKKSGG